MLDVVDEQLVLVALHLAGVADLRVAPQWRQINGQPEGGADGVGVGVAVHQDVGLTRPAREVHQHIDALERGEAAQHLPAVAAGEGIRLSRPLARLRRRCSLPSQNTATVGGSHSLMRSDSSSVSAAMKYGG